MLRKSEFIKIVVISLTLLLFAVGTYGMHGKMHLIIGWIQNLGWIAPLLFLLLYWFATLSLLPTMVLTLAGGALFGPFLGSLLNLIGANLGAICAFCISRYYATHWLFSFKRNKINQFNSAIERWGWQFIAFLRLIPILPFNLVNYGLGLTRIKFTHYTITTLIFLAPAEIIYTYCGHAGMEVLTNPAPAYRYLVRLFDLMNQT